MPLWKSSGLRTNDSEHLSVDSLTTVRSSSRFPSVPLAWDHVSEEWEVSEN